MRVHTLACALWAAAYMFSASPAKASTAGTCHRDDGSTLKQLLPGDSATSVRLTATRITGPLRSLHIQACYSELRIVAGTDDRIHLQITSGDGGKPLDNFLDEFTSHDGEVVLTLNITKSLHPIVTVSIPRSENDFASHVDLGAGRLQLKRDELRGNRELNVGAGSVYAELDGNHDYAKLVTNIGIGHLSDERTVGHGRSFAVSREIHGDGNGDLEINVGAGTIHLTQMLIIPNYP